MSVLGAIFHFFYEICFGCRHNRVTRPFTLDEQTYMVCLDCGKQIYYSMETMAPLSAREMRRMKATQAGEVRMLPASSAGPSLVRKRARKSGAAA